MVGDIAGRYAPVSRLMPPTDEPPRNRHDALAPLGTLALRASCSALHVCEIRRRRSQP